MPGNADYMHATSGGTNSSVSSNWGSGSSSSNNGSSGNNNQNSPAHPGGGYDKNKNIPQDPRSYTASGQAQNDYEDSLPAEPVLTGLDALIANKDKLQNIPAGNGLNQYQVEMEKFKNSPGGLALFKKKFPNPLVKIAQGLGSYIKKGGVIGILADALGGSKDAASKFTQNASTMAKDLGSLLGLDSLNTKLLGIAAGGDDADVSNFIKGQQAYDPSGLEGYKDSIFKDLYAQMPDIDVSMEDEYSNFQPDSDINPYPVGSLQYTQKQIELMKDKYMSDNTEDVVDEEKTLIDLGLIGEQPLSSVTENVSETNYDTSGLKNQIMNNPGTTTFGAVPGQNFNVFDPDAYLQENPITEDMIETGIIGQANGGYMSSFPNQNLNTESLSASDNIDDRIMKNLEFEKMAPGMMGYNSGGKVMSTYDKLKAIADNNYG